MAKKEKNEQAVPEEAVEVKETVTETKEEKKKDTSPGRWYVVHTYSGHENKVAATLKQKIKASGFEDQIFEILVPTQEKLKSGKEKSYSSGKDFPRLHFGKNDPWR